MRSGWVCGGACISLSARRIVSGCVLPPGGVAEVRQHRHAESSKPCSDENRNANGVHEDEHRLPFPIRRLRIADIDETPNIN